MDAILMKVHNASTIKINMLPAPLLASPPLQETGPESQRPHQEYFLLVSFISAVKTNTGQTCFLYGTEVSQCVCSKALKK